MIRKVLKTRLHGYIFAALFVLTCSAGFAFACTGSAPGSTLGQPCSASEPCGPDAVCDSQLGICVAPRGTDGGIIPGLDTGGFPDSTSDSDPFFDTSPTGAP